MVEHSIVFSAEMVKAILAGRKTQTRRVIPNRYGICAECWAKADAEISMFIDSETSQSLPYLKPIYCEHNDCTAGRIFCPYGQVGDRLWCQETFWEQSGDIYYKADWGNERPVNMILDKGKWRSPIFMPRWASRITLEIIGVRVERLQEITEEDAKAEGVEWGEALSIYDDTKEYERWEGYKAGFIVLWDSIYVKEGYCWDVNPWVWKIGFRKVK